MSNSRLIFKSFHYLQLKLHFYRNSLLDMQIEQYLGLGQDSSQNYKLSSKLLNHSKVIHPKYRIKLFEWLSQECYKQRINRFAFVLTCTYIDLYFMKGNDVKKKEDYQYLALGALILACKQVQKSGKVPLINTNLISVNLLLEMQNLIVTKLEFYLNPPNYIQILNNIAKIWDTKCNKESLYPSIRYLQNNANSYKKIKRNYEIMDYLYLFHEMLDFDIFEFVLTIFYVLTKIYYLEQEKVSTPLFQELLIWKPNPDPFQTYFCFLLEEYEIKTRINNEIIKKTVEFRDLQISHLVESVSEDIIVRISLFQTYNTTAYKKALVNYQKQATAIYRKQRKTKSK